MLFSTLMVLAAAPLFFGDEQLGWYVISERGEVLQRLTTFGGEAAAEAAMHPDTQTFVFTSAGPPSQRQLFRWRTGEAKPAPLLPERGYYARPSFAPAGDWLYFTHNGGGPPGSHETGMNAQVFRVKPDGSGLERLTNSSGCKLSPSASDGRALFYLHSSCNSSARAETVSLAAIDGGTAARAFGESAWNVLELAVTRDGRRVAVVEARVPGTAVYEYSTADKAQPRTLAQFEFRGLTMLPQWSHSGDALYVKELRNIWKLTPGGKPKLLVTLEAAGDVRP